MTEVRKKRILGLLMFLTVQVVTLAVLDHQLQTDAPQPIPKAGPSFTTQMLVPILAMWESMHTTVVTAYLKQRAVSRSISNDGEDEQEQSIQNGNVRSKRRKRDPLGRDHLDSVLTSSCKALEVAYAEHIQGLTDCNNRNSELDRAQRREQSGLLLTVLKELAGVLGFIAEKL